MAELQTVGTGCILQFFPLEVVSRKKKKKRKERKKKKPYQSIRKQQIVRNFGEDIVKNRHDENMMTQGDGELLQVFSQCINVLLVSWANSDCFNNLPVH